MCPLHFFGSLIANGGRGETPLSSWGNMVQMCRQCVKRKKNILGLILFLSLPVHCKHNLRGFSGISFLEEALQYTNIRRKEIIQGRISED